MAGLRTSKVFGRTDRAFRIMAACPSFGTAVGAGKGTCLASFSCSSSNPAAGTVRTPCCSSPSAAAFKLNATEHRTFAIRRMAASKALDGEHLAVLGNSFVNYQARTDSAVCPATFAVVLHRPGSYAKRHY